MSEIDLSKQIPTPGITAAESIGRSVRAEGFEVSVENTLTMEAKDAPMSARLCGCCDPECRERGCKINRATSKKPLVLCAPKDTGALKIEVPSGVDVVVVCRCLA